jgi:hypothetical protein
MSDGEEFRSIAAMVQRQGEDLRSHVDGCAALNVQTATALVKLEGAHTQIAQEISSFKKIMSAIGAIVLTAFMSVMAQNYVFHKETTATAKAAVLTATSQVRYTAEDAAKDRAAQDAIDREILTRLAALNHKKGHP